MPPIPSAGCRNRRILRLLGSTVALGALAGAGLLGGIDPAHAQPLPPPEALSTAGQPPSTPQAESRIGVGRPPPAPLDAAPADRVRPLSTAPSPAAVVAQVTGADGVDDLAARWAITGTDLGIMWDDGNGGVLTAFGDTFGEWPPGPDGGGGGGDWRSNVLVRSTDRDLSDGMTFDWAVEDRPGHAGEIVPSLKQNGVEITTIPTAGIQVGGVQYLAYMSVREWGAPGLWDTNYSRIAYSTDGGATWNHTDGPTWENPGAENSTGDHPFQMVGFEHHDGYVWMFGTPNGRAGAAHVARVPETAVLDKSAYEYWTGAAWESGEGADRRAAPVIEPGVSELSVRFDDHSNKWLITYLDEDLDVVLRAADAPTGTWGQKQVIASFADFPSLYGSYFHPWSTDGELYLTLSQWVPYNAYLLKVSIDENGEITRPNLVADPGLERQIVAEDADSAAVAAPWTCTGDCVVRDDFTAAYAGEHHGLLGGTPGSHTLSQRLAVTADTAYAVTTWALAPSTGTASVAVRAADGRVLAEAAVPATGEWARVDLPFRTGTATAVDLVTSARTTTSGDGLRFDDASVVERVDAAGEAFTATVAPRCVAGRLLLEVTATNPSADTVRLRVDSAHGSRSLGVLRPGTSRTALLNTRTDSIDAGSMTLTGGPLQGATTSVTVTHGPQSCR